MENRSVFFLKWLYVIIQFIFISNFYNVVQVNKEVIFWLIFLLLASIITRKAFFCKHESKRRYIKYFIFFEFILVTIITYLSQNGNVNLHVLLIAESAFYLSQRLSIIISIMVFLFNLYPLSYIYSNDYISEMGGFILGILLSYGLVFFIKKYLTHNEKLVQTTKELEMKKLELEKAYEKLQKNYDMQEEIIVLRERNKIAGEIHDTVGHTLTTVLIEMEAGKRLINKNNIDLGMEKINLAQEQVRKGMNDIRKSVRSLKDGNELLSFAETLKKLISETEKHTEITIDTSISSELPELDIKIKKIIYRALQEGLTNGIKHGKSKKFGFRLFFKDEGINFSLKDYGEGCENYKLGFGLSNMKYKVEEKNGTFHTHSKTNKGFTIDIKIPV